MATASSIEWTQTTWNPILGCSKVSSGCAHCYAERMANRLAAIARAAERDGKNPGRAGHYREVVTADGKWNGRIYLDESAVEEPLGWRLPRIVFVNSMSDLFHEGVPAAFIRRLFDVMRRCPQHTFQVLTKRPQRAAAMADQLDWPGNIWLGTSVENQAVVGRIDDLRRVPAAVRFLSLEPLLGPLPRLPLRGIHWCIVGGESGPGARPMRREWVEQIRARCERYAVPFFFKQWGGVHKKAAGRELDGRTWDGMPGGVEGGCDAAA